MRPKHHLYYLFLVGFLASGPGYRIPASSFDWSRKESLRRALQKPTLRSTHIAGSAVVGPAASKAADRRTVLSSLSSTVPFLFFPARTHAQIASALISSRLFRRSRARVETLSPVIVSMDTNENVDLTLHFTLSRDIRLTNGADSRWQVLLVRDREGDDAIVLATGLWEEKEGLDFSALVTLPLPNTNQNPYNRLEVESRVYYCDISDACRSDNRLFEISLIDKQLDAKGQSSISIAYNIAPPVSQMAY